MKNEYAIDVKNLTKKYHLGRIDSKTLQEEILNRHNLKEDKEFYALKDLSFNVLKGETLGIIGSNGAGKSTLLKILSNITSPTAGEISVRGRVSSMLEVGTGFHREMTGRENIYMNGMILGMKKVEIEKVIEDIIDFSEIREFIDTPVKRYSSGMYVKLAFSIAIFLNNEIVIMDEILSVGDLSFQEKCIKKIKDLAIDSNKTILLVSHNLNLIRRLATRVLVLEKGEIGFIGETEDAIAYYMNQAISNNELHRDLNKVEHSKNADNSIRMVKLDILNKDYLIYSSNESLEFVLTVDSKIKTDKGILRFTLRNESDIGLGSCYIDSLKIKEGINELKFSFPLEQIEKGLFYISLGLHIEDLTKGIVVLDHITRLIRFEVKTIKPWRVSTNGYFKLSVKDLNNES